jgi:hypothetical protein
MAFALGLTIGIFLRGSGDVISPIRRLKLETELSVF